MEITFNFFLQKRGHRLFQNMLHTRREDRVTDHSLSEQEEGKRGFGSWDGQRHHPTFQPLGAVSQKKGVEVQRLVGTLAGTGELVRHPDGASVN